MFYVNYRALFGVDSWSKLTGKPFQEGDLVSLIKEEL